MDENDLDAANYIASELRSVRAALDAARGVSVSGGAFRYEFPGQDSGRGPLFWIQAHHPSSESTSRAIAGPGLAPEAILTDWLAELESGLAALGVTPAKRN